jgi:hypothetical protein
MLLALLCSVVSNSAPAQDADGFEGEEWAVWYVDTFDREMPPNLEVRGRGLVEGLVELWARHMFETVRPEGPRGFSSFDLRWRHGRVSISGDEEGARRLRGWLFGSTVTSREGYVQISHRELLQRVAVAHARLTSRGESAEPILALARSAVDEADFVSRLDTAAAP